MENKKHQDGTLSTKEYIGKDKEVIIPDKIGKTPVTAIEEWAFEENTVIETIDIPSSIIIIKEDAFGGCKTLKKYLLMGK